VASLKETAIGLGRDEQGASMVFATITLFALVVATMFVYQIGLVSADRLQMQSAADAAAYSAAQVQANSLNSIGQINDGMAYLNYVLLRYTADAIVYGTLDQFRRHRSVPATGRYEYVLMGNNGNTAEGLPRIQHVQQLFNPNRFENLAAWVLELHYAGRIVMAATPRLARQTAVRIAGENGAQFVGVSRDMDLAFRVEETQPAGGPEQAGAGFQEIAGGGNAQQFAESMYRRYERRLVQHINVQGGGAQSSPQAQILPAPSGGWFDPVTGRLNGEYTQVRICWNDNDWAHHFGNPNGTGQVRGATHEDGTYGQFTRGAPNGHWHLQHTHEVPNTTSTTPPTITLAHQIPPDRPPNQPGGHYRPMGFDDDTYLHDQATALGTVEPHHGVQECNTCNPAGGADDEALSYSRKFSEVKKSSNDLQGDFQTFSNVQGNRANHMYNQIFPKPLMINERLLQSGVTVVTWRPGRGTGDLLPAPPWGMVAIGSAAVGYQTAMGVVPLDHSNPFSTASRVGNDGRTQSVSIARYRGGGVRIQAPYANASDGAQSTSIPYVSSGADPNHRNLFYGDQVLTHSGNNYLSGVRFGARLAPIASELTWNPALNTNALGLSELINQGNAVWYDVTNVGGAAINQPAALDRLTTSVTVNGERVGGVFQVGSEADRSKLWH